MGHASDLIERARKMKTYAAASGRRGTAAIIEELMAALIESEQSVACQMELVEFWKAKAPIERRSDGDG